MRYRAATLATAAAVGALLAVSAASPALAAEGRLWWTSDGYNWRLYTPPAYEVCVKPLVWTHSPATTLVNDLDVDVQLYPETDCVGDPVLLPAGEETDFTTRSILIPAS
ncbi:hypothetical protein [Actinorugispora endophytica]|uniref:Secreted protein n=1 Tax=Actinorugispora endophytica TaxID=1605990 RepID=A0A4R6VDE6_9ACTN|nr:hypothetical protein [Actinorugispora endophytica]TDQ55017.1 hypothetical protein EV190_101338 [Actinorugispora endophytica]